MDNINDVNDASALEDGHASLDIVTRLRDSAMNGDVESARALRRLLETETSKPLLSAAFELPIENIEEDYRAAYFLLPIEDDLSIHTLLDKDRFNPIAEEIAARGRDIILANPRDHKHVRGAAECLAVLHARHTNAHPNATAKTLVEYAYREGSSDNWPMTVGPVLQPFRNHCPQVISLFMSTAVFNVAAFLVEEDMAVRAKQVLGCATLWVLLNPVQEPLNVVRKLWKLIKLYVYDFVEYGLVVQGIDWKRVEIWLADQTTSIGLPSAYDAMRRAAEIIQLSSADRFITVDEEKGLSSHRAKWLKEHGGEDFVSIDKMDVPIDVLLGTYSPAEQKITLYIDEIAGVAQLLNVEATDLRRVVELHEAAHATIHLAQSASGIGFW